AQDQVIAAYGGFNHVHFCVDGSIDVKPVVAPQSRLAELENHLVLFFTGFTRTASEIAKEQLRETPKRKGELGAMLQMVNEAKDIISNTNRQVSEIGRVLHESWKLQTSLSCEITSPRIEQIDADGLRLGGGGGVDLGV